MTKKAKPVTSEQVRVMVLMLRSIKSQLNKEPKSKKEIAESVGQTTTELSGEFKHIEVKGWVARRTGEKPKAIYFKVTAAGTAAIKAYDVLYG